MRRIVVMAALVATQTACLGGPSLIREQPRDYLSANAPGVVWATLTNGDRLVISGPRVIADTIFGWAEGEEIVIPVEDVKEVRVRQLSIWRSSLMPTAVVGLSMGAIFLVTAPKGDADRDRSQECEDMGGMCEDLADGPGM